MSVRLSPDREALRTLVAVARRSRPADLVVAPGGVVDVFTETVHEGWGVVVSAGRIAYVGPEAAKFEAASRIEGDDHLVAPGLVDPHSHLLRVGLAQTMPLQVRAGVTTTVFEGMEIAYLLGPDGVRELVAEAAGMPGRALFTVPAAAVPDPLHDHGLGSAERWVELLDLPGVVGIGEVNWTDVIRGHHRVEGLVEGALRRGLTVEGHGAGAREPSLNAMAAAGITADHEGIDPTDSLNRARLGFFVELRHGATRQDLAALAPLWRDGLVSDWGRFAFVSDGVEIGELACLNSLNRVVELAIEAGMPLARAVRLGSRGPAERFGLGRWIGGLGPGMLADLVLIDRDGTFRPEMVLVGGRPPSAPRAHTWPEASLRSVTLPAGLGAEAFRAPGRGRHRAMEAVAPLVTREAESEGPDALPVTALERLGGGRRFTGLIKGYGLRGGAVATSSAWDSPCLLVAGDDPDACLAAARAVEAMQGGAAVVRDGRVVARWQADLAGVWSREPIEAVVRDITAVNDQLAAMGVSWPNPLLSLEVLTTGVIPHLRIGPEGYIRLKDNARLGLAL